MEERKSQIKHVKFPDSSFTVKKDDGQKQAQAHSHRAKTAVERK